jgi:hypothetical protein
MFNSTLNLHLMPGRTHELRAAAQRGRLIDRGETPVTRVTIRQAAAGDAARLSHLAQLDSAEVPGGQVLVAEVDGRLRAALPLNGSAPIADPFHRGTELIELLRLRAAQLRAA